MTRNSAQNRRLDVLRAIVTQYVATREPVGSKAIAAGGLGVSSATIRNDMAVLEEAGLIYQPHTSAGRVPTDRGYRVFVPPARAAVRAPAGLRAPLPRRDPRGRPRGLALPHHPSRLRLFDTTRPWPTLASPRGWPRPRRIYAR